MYIVDNEASADLKKGLKKYKFAYQLVPRHVHQRNAAERAIQTFKNNFLAFLSTCDPAFPVTEWDLLLFQAELTLNLLRSLRVNPKLSAYAYLNGNFDFNKTPLAPPGTKVVVHLKPDQCASWAYHGEEAWYVAPSMEHYRYVKSYIPSTARERDINTLHFFLKKIPFPSIYTEDYLKQAASNILAILQKLPSSLPFLAYGDPTCHCSNCHPPRPDSRSYTIATVSHTNSESSDQSTSSKGTYPITSTSEGIVANGTDFQTLTFETPAITSEGGCKCHANLAVAYVTSVHKHHHSNT
jgi:hypothetical protein